MTVGGPMFGRPGGEHRVLEPPGAVPMAATRLDALAELWDGEVRLELEAVVHTAAGMQRWTDQLGSDVGRLTGAFTETIAERGGLGLGSEDAVLVGTIETIGARHPGQVAVGERVAVAMPARAIPLFALPLERWDGGRVVPVRGHAVLPARAPTVPVGDAPAAYAAVLAQVADLPVSLASGRRVLVIGTDRPEGAVALVAAAARGSHVTAVVDSLAAARLARGLGATLTAVVATGEPVDGGDHLAERVPDGHDLVVLADPTGAALAARLAATVQVVADQVQAPTLAAEVLGHARGLGRDVEVLAGRRMAEDRGAGLRRLLDTQGVLSATLRWQAGVGSLPSVPARGDDPEDA